MRVRVRVRGRGRGRPNLLHVDDVVGEGDAEARLLQHALLRRVELAVQEVVRAVGHG